MTRLVVGVWVVTLAWLVAGFVVFRFAIEQPLRDRGVPAPTGFRPPAFIGKHTGELLAYRMQRLRAGRNLLWWRVMIAWRCLLCVLAPAALLVTVFAALDFF